MKRLTKVVVIGLVALLVATGIFGAGVLVGSNTSPLAQAGSFRPQDAPEDFPKEFDIFYQAWDIVEERFVDQEALDETAMTYGAIEGMLKALGDEGHTDFLTPKELEYQRSDISGTYKGIGARLGVRDGLPIIVTPFDGSPADEAGVKAGDIIMAVDGEDTTGMELNDVVDRIRGPENTQVTLTLLRLDETKNESLDIVITRQEIEVPATDWAMVPGTNVAYLRLTQFSANATDGIQAAVAEIKDAGAEAIVLDLRNNPGGLLEQAVKVTSQFLTTGNVLQEEDAQGQRRVYRVQRGGVATDIPMVVLVNAGTASSAEIMAGALQDYDRAELVGDTTFGTGTVLEPFMLNDGSALLLGTRQWLTAKGRQLRKQGVTPDEELKLSITTDLVDAPTLEDTTYDDLLKSDDLQFLRALELLGAVPEGTVVLDNESLDVQAIVNDSKADTTEADGGTDGAMDASTETEPEATPVKQ
ncbi:MAG: S41 family peptidase [Caldilineaceae bacterium]|nr:S41 family peptidase [Caldilineaceae bacterium]